MQNREFTAEFLNEIYTYAVEDGFSRDGCEYSLLYGMYMNPETGFVDCRKCGASDTQELVNPGTPEADFRCGECGAILGVRHNTPFWGFQLTLVSMIEIYGMEAEGGTSAREIAQHLGVSESTAKRLRKRLYAVDPSLDRWTHVYE